MIRVLIVEDCPVMQKLLSAFLDNDEDIAVIGAASDPYEARTLIKQLHPDVITLDVQMPLMDGVTFLGHLMRLKPLPVVMVSGGTTEGADLTIQALETGAVDFVAKPTMTAPMLVEKVKEAASVNRLALRRKADVDDTGSVKTTSLAKPGPKTDSKKRLKKVKTHQIVAIGASTGGTEAIKEILKRLPDDMPGIVITQHIPPVFSRSFAARMNATSDLTVCEAEDGQVIMPGHAYVAPGDRHLEVVRKKNDFVCKLSDGAPVSRHKPSVDVLFDSVAKNCGSAAVGVILTGMGKDGANGLRAMSDAGAQTIAQDQTTSVVWGMPGAAVKNGAAQHVLPLTRIAKRLKEIG